MSYFLAKNVKKSTKRRNVSCSSQDSPRMNVCVLKQDTKKGRTLNQNQEKQHLKQAGWNNPRGHFFNINIFTLLLTKMTCLDGDISSR